MKTSTFKQRLALAVHSSPKANSVSMPYGFQAYAKAAAKCNNKRLSYNEPNKARNTNQRKAAMNYQTILNAKSSLFQLVNTHELKQGDVILHMGMVIVVGEKQISTAHKDQGYGECQYHKSQVVATAPSVGSMTTWNVQGNKLAMWSKWLG